jgi:phage/plasmid-associated DNA primase
VGEPPSVREATAQYRAEQDLVGQFLTERCIVSGLRTMRTSRKAVYDAYTAWCTATGTDQLGKQTFTDKLRERGVGEGKDGGERVWVGLALTTPDAIQHQPRDEERDDRGGAHNASLPL